MLDLIEMALQAEGILYERVDGSMPRSGRDRALNAFKQDPACNILLATIGSAGVG